jgi:sulfite exporter TauE/SafE
MVATALLVGLAGSLHCVGMCSPLAMAVSGISKSYLINRLLYNGGRIIMYGLLGAAVGAFGAIAGLTGWQTVISAVLGLFLILFGLSGVQAIRIPLLTPVLHRFTGWLKIRFAHQLKIKGKVSLLLLGALNGLLPCGLTYFALTYCITLPNATQGFVFMLLFGMGTLPAMLGLPSLVQSLAAKTKWRMQRLSTVVMIVLGAMLVIRSAYFYQSEMHAPSAQASEVVCP